MDFELEFTREAEVDFKEIDCFFYALGIVERFYEDFNRQMTYIQNNPFLFQLRYKNVRIAHLQNFKYSIHFIILHKTITVLRILEQHRHF